MPKAVDRPTNLACVNILFGMADTNQERLVRVEEQIKAVKSDVGEIKDDIKEIKAVFEGSFVTKEDFENYKKSQIMQKVVMGFVSLAMGGLIGYFFATIVK